eukprot:757260-Hanusia_phi.AAC.3
MRLKGKLESEYTGQIMQAAEDLKKTPKDQKSAVQREILRVAADVKNVKSDVQEMVERNKDPEKMADR